MIVIDTLGNASYMFLKIVIRYSPESTTFGNNRNAQSIPLPQEIQLADPYLYFIFTNNRKINRKKNQQK